MGLAFDLEAPDIGGQIDWHTHFLLAKQTLELVVPGNPLANRWDDIEVVNIAEFDIRIRKIFDMNGVNVIVGSYRAEFTLNPHGIAGFQYAWDGFVAINRSFKWVNPLDQNYQTWVAKSGFAPFIGPTQIDTWLIIPMRMPYEWCPGGTAAQIAADDTVGLYGVDGAKNLDTLLDSNYGTAANNYSQVAVCGFGRIDGTVEGALSDQDYVGALYTIPISWDIYLRNLDTESTLPILGAVFGDELKAYHQYTWKATQANHIDNTPATAQFNAMDLDTVVRDNTSFAPISFATYPPAAVQLVAARGYYPRRFLDVASVLIIPGWDIATELTGGPICIAGDCVKDDGAGAVDYSAPLAVGGIPFAAPDASGGTPQIALTARTDENILVEDLATAYNLEGAWFSLVMPTADFILTSSIVNNNLPPILFAAENVLHGADRKAEIYAMTGSDDSADSAWTLGQYPYRFGAAAQVGDASIGPFAISGGSWETATGLTLPDRWVNRIQQMRTFTVDEEHIAKSTLTRGGTIPVPEGVTAIDWQPKDSQGVLVGTIGNQPRFGAPNSSAQEEVVAGVANKIAAGFLGYSGSAGSRSSFALVFDVGSISFTTTDLVAPFTFNPTGAFTSQASAILDILDEADADAVILSGDWDNDRDQWLFVIGRSTVGKMGVVSAASDFTQFIDQSDNLKVEMGVMPGVPTNYAIFDSGLYKSRLMTNELDGLIIGGNETDLAGPGITLAPVSTGAGFPSYNEIYVKGTTGRTCRVWIDYVLYDGAEALIAVKLANLGLRVNPENVEWFKARILNNLGIEQLDMKTEEIEAWMEAQSKQYRDMMRTKERSGRLRRRKAQVSSYLGGIDEAILDANGLNIDNSGKPQGLDPEGIEDLLKNMDPSKLPPDVDES